MLKKPTNTKQFFLKYLIPFAAVAMLVNVVLTLLANPKREILDVAPNQTTIAAFVNSVSGLGVTEPQSEIINIGTNISGIVSNVHIAAGANVKEGDALFTIDDREAAANLELKQAQAQAALLDAKDKQREFEMYKKINDSRAYSADDFSKKEIAAQIAEQKARQAQAEVEIARVALDKLTVKSPLDAQVLKVDVRVGEYAQSGALSKPLMMLGDLSKMHVRVEIDETESARFNLKKSAIAYLRGSPGVKISLNFVRVEPYVVPKLSISGGSAEKIDTRVMQIIYSFDNPNNKILVGQQMDVYVEADSVSSQKMQEAK